MFFPKTFELDLSQCWYCQSEMASSDPQYVFNLLKKRTRHNCCGGGRRVTGKAVTIFLWSSNRRHKVHQQDRVGMTTAWQDKRIEQVPKPGPLQPVGTRPTTRVRWQKKSSKTWRNLEASSPWKISRTTGNSEFFSIAGQIWHET